MPKVIDEEKIFKAVIDMLVSQGYGKARTQEIANMAGVNQATIFRKYGSKARLFEQAIRHQLADTPLDTIAYTGNLEADLTMIVTAYLETNRRYGAIIPAMVAELPRHPELKTAFEVLWENTRGAVQLIAAYQKSGELIDESPTASLNSLLGPLMTRQMFIRAALTDQWAEVDAQEHVNRFLHGRKVTN